MSSLCRMKHIQSKFLPGPTCAVQCTCQLGSNCSVLSLCFSLPSSFGASIIPWVHAQITGPRWGYTELAHEAASQDLVCLLVSQRHCQAGVDAGCMCCMFCMCWAEWKETGAPTSEEVGEKRSVPVWRAALELEKHSRHGACDTHSCEVAFGEGSIVWSFCHAWCRRWSEQVCLQ